MSPNHSLIVFSALRLSAFKEFTISQNPTFSAIRHTVFTQLHLNYSLIACTVFCLRPFMKALTTYYGTAGDTNLGSSNGYGCGSGSGRRELSGSYGSGRPGDFQMVRLKGRSGYRSGGQLREIPELGDRKERGKVVCEAGSSSPLPSSEGRADGDCGSLHSGSDKSTRMIIRKDVEYSVSVGNA